LRAWHRGCHGGRPGRGRAFRPAPPLPTPAHDPAGAAGAAAPAGATVGAGIGAPPTAGGAVDAYSQVSRFHTETLEAVGVKGVDLVGVQVRLDKT
jgi:hypothetical protein